VRIGASLSVNACWQPVHVIAYDYDSDSCTNWSSTNGYCIS